MEATTIENPYEGITFFPDAQNKYAIVEGRRILGTFSTLAEAVTARKAILSARRRGRNPRSNYEKATL